MAQKSGISVGAGLRDVLLNDQYVAAILGAKGKVYPVVTDEAVLPYIVYRRLSLVSSPTKARGEGLWDDEVQIEMLCCAPTYAAGVELAERVRKALDGFAGEVIPNLVVRSCRLADSEESWQDDAWVQRLVFAVKATMIA